MKFILVATIALLASFSLHADTATCSYTLNEVGITNFGGVEGHIYIHPEGSSLMIICNAKQQFMRTSPESYSVMYSTLFAAYSSNKKSI